MRLVDREKRHRHPCSQGKEALRLQPLRRDVQKLILSGGRFCIGASQLLERQRAVEKRRRYPCLRQRCYLVFHQGNERRDHNRQPRQQQRRKLIADRLSPAGRHHAQHIAPGQNRVNQRLLPAAERRVTEIPLEQRPFFLHRLLLSDAYHRLTQSVSLKNLFRIENAYSSSGSCSSSNAFSASSKIT